MENKNRRIIGVVVGVLGALFGVMNTFGFIPDFLKTPAVYGVLIGLAGAAIGVYYCKAGK